MGGFELPDGNAAAHRVMANAKILRQLGYRVILVGVRKSNGTGLSINAESFEEFECWSIEYPQTKKQWWSYLIGLRDLEKFLGMYSEDLSGVIFYNYPAIAQWRFSLRCRALGGLCITDVTEWYESSGGNLLLRMVKSIDTWLRMHVVIPASDGVITISNWMTARYRRAALPVVEIPPLVDLDALPKQAHVSEPGRRRFVYVGSPFAVGRVNEKRSNLKDRLDLCVALFHDLHRDRKGFVFDVYGVSEDDYLTVFPEHSEKLREMGASIQFHGRVLNAVAKQVIADSDFSIFFRDKTRVTLAGFPTKLAESISLGTPVISNLYQNVEPYASQQGLLLANPGEERAMLLRALSLSDAEVRDLKAACRVSGLFDYRAYREVMANFLSGMETS